MVIIRLGLHSYIILVFLFTMLVGAGMVVGGFVVLPLLQMGLRAGVVLVFQYIIPTRPLDRLGLHYLSL